jgi:hypothetical protein
LSNVDEDEKLDLRDVSVDGNVKLDLLDKTFND